MYIARHPLAALLIVALCTPLAGCELFSVVESQSCETLTQTCTCTGGSQGVAICDESLLSITGCDCSEAVHCEESTRTLCQCASPGVGLTSCEGSNDPDACVCAEFEGDEQETTPYALREHAGMHILDGDCQEFSGAPVVPWAGFSSSPEMARSSCRLMWRARADGSPAQILGCCLVPDVDTWATASADDPATIKSTADSAGDDRIELSFGQDASRIYQLALNTTTPRPLTLLTAILDGAVAPAPQLATAAAVSRSGSLNTTSDVDVGYIMEWSTDIPDGTLQVSTTFACQLSRYDVTRAMMRSPQIEQEHAFGALKSAPPLSQMGSCIMQQ